MPTYRWPSAVTADGGRKLVLRMSRTLADVVEGLMAEFEDQLPLGAVFEVVQDRRKSLETPSGHAGLDAVETSARRRLVAMSSQRRGRPARRRSPKVSH
jgi:hypothetical protein